MLYPVYIHVGDETHAHGVTVPDFPGCYSAADHWDALPTRIQEAIELYCEGEDMDIPAPTPLEKLATQLEYEGGVLMLVDGRHPTLPPPGSVDCVLARRAGETDRRLCQISSSDAVWVSGEGGIGRNGEGLTYKYRL